MGRSILCSQAVPKFVECAGDFTAYLASHWSLNGLELSIIRLVMVALCNRADHYIFAL